MARGPVSARKFRTSHKVLRRHFRTAQTLNQFHAQAKELTPGDRARIVEQAIMLLESFYVNLPVKCAMYAVDPLRRLGLLQQRLPNIFKSDRLFHREMTHIFTSLGDQHANYLLPAPFNKANALLPFKIELCDNGGRPTYLVSRIVEGFSAGAFREGVEILSWNGVPSARAVEMAGAQSSGSNLAGQRALGLFSLTARPLVVLPPPDEEWVVVGYRTKRGRMREIRVQWIIAGLPPATDEVAPRGVSVHVARIQEIRKFLFAPDVVESDRKMSAARNPLSRVKGTETTMPSVFRPDVVTTPHGKFGYLRIFTFDVTDGTALVNEFVRLIKLLPQNGLIVDVRSNPGGRSRAAEEMLQLISPNHPKDEIEPERLNFITTPRTLQLCKLQKANRDLGPMGGAPWIESIQRAMETGATYSANFPYSDRKVCNARGRLYPGPVIVVTNVLSRSAAEIFAAGFQDHGGTIL